MLKAEMDYELEYEKYSRKPVDNDNIETIIKKMGRNSPLGSTNMEK
ncbi:hypothetical protein [Marinitoga sp. 1138]|nr:hypothetical protein [Marinitoga sp. 1138]